MFKQHRMHHMRPRLCFPSEGRLTIFTKEKKTWGEGAICISPMVLVFTRWSYSAPDPKEKLDLCQDGVCSQKLKGKCAVN